MAIVVTGGAGYIGAHITLALLRSGHDVVVADNLSNSSAVSVERVAKLARRKVRFVQLDLRDRPALNAVFDEQSIDAVIHLAGSKAVGESVADPHSYYDNNIGSTLVLTEVMAQHRVQTLVFSSSATVYKPIDSDRYDEDSPLGPVNPYGRTKLFIEQYLQDLVASPGQWSIAALRYFNPVGADASGLIGEDPSGPPNNLLPYITQVLVGHRAELSVFGDDYPTPDGTGIRDYIHVGDLADGHLSALTFCRQNPGQFDVFNLGTGRGYSVLEVIRAMEAVSGRSVPYTIKTRRLGDTARSVADPSRASRELDWRARRDLREACADSWRWQLTNPAGYP